MTESFKTHSKTGISEVFMALGIFALMYNTDCAIFHQYITELHSLKKFYTLCTYVFEKSAQLFIYEVDSAA